MPRSPLARTGLLIGGSVLIVVSPIIGAIPGPGGIFVFAGGLVMVLRASPRARRGWVTIKRRWPRLGEVADRAMRRRSVARRRARGRAGPAAAPLD